MTPSSTVNKDELLKFLQANKVKCESAPPLLIPAVTEKKKLNGKLKLHLSQ